MSFLVGSSVFDPIEKTTMMKRQCKQEVSLTYRKPLFLLASSFSVVTYGTSFLNPQEPGLVALELICSQCHLVGRVGSGGEEVAVTLCSWEIHPGILHWNPNALSQTSLEMTSRNTSICYTSDVVWF